ncbi:MAG: quinone oxidoreductase [Acidimicrobiia bacterium]|nr:quinone oxidoreductase [Acidimicrobiia bacterium]
MRAVVIDEHGGPEVLHYREHPEPVPGPGEALVAVTAAGLNFIDTYHRTGLYPVQLPLVLGNEGAGTVVAAAEDVESVATGDRVAFSQVLSGSYADLAAVRAAELVRVPDGVDLEVAAAAMLQGMTAHYLCTSTFPLDEGDVCLIHAGAGGVGLLLTQMAKLRGATVIATAGSDEKVALSRRAGADHVINYDDVDFGDAVEEIAGPKAVDVVYDGVGRTTVERGLDLLRPRGMMVSFGNASGPPAPIDPLVLASKGSLFLTRPSLPHYLATREELEWRAGDLLGWIEQGAVEVRIGARFALSDAADAHRALEGRATTGKVILIQPS